MHDVSRFVEKPDLATAERYLAAGNFYWNTGIFLFRAGAMRDAFKRLQPDIWNDGRKGVRRCDELIFPASICRSISMRPSHRLDRLRDHGEARQVSPWCRPGFRWNDLGSWQSLLDISPADRKAT